MKLPLDTMPSIEADLQVARYLRPNGSEKKKEFLTLLRSFSDKENFCFTNFCSYLNLLRVNKTL